MVECGGLENRWGRKTLGGSNPPPSASVTNSNPGISRPAVPGFESLYAPLQERMGLTTKLLSRARRELKQ